jgi:sulfatase modifying factor 1
MHQNKKLNSYLSTQCTIGLKKLAYLLSPILIFVFFSTCTLLRTTAVPIKTIRIENANVENIFFEQTHIEDLRAEWRGNTIDIISQPKNSNSGKLIASFSAKDDYKYEGPRVSSISSEGRIFSMKQFSEIRWEDIGDPSEVKGTDLVFVLSAEDDQYRDMVYIPGGRFNMGSKFQEDEKPVHTVSVQGFYMDKYEVTVKQYREYCKATRRSMPKQPFWNDDIHPVVNVSWIEANKYAKWAGKRLPTEAEWEYAARSGSIGNFYDWGNVRPFRKKGANIADEALRTEKRFWRIWKGYYDGFVYTSPVGSFYATLFGLHDMTGNVLEWCADWYDKDYYAHSPSENPKGPEKGIHRSIRGGSWNFAPRDVLTTRRFHYRPDVKLDHLGFRCVKNR